MTEETTMTRTHILKTWPEPFQAVLDGRKRYEIRVDDRGFAVGDILHIKEWDPSPKTFGTPLDFHYTSRTIRARVLYITPGGSWGLPANLCVMSISPERLP